MAGPHRALAETRNAVESAFRDAGIDAGSRVLLAVSGGSDSMALAQAAQVQKAMDLHDQRLDRLLAWLGGLSPR